VYVDEDDGKNGDEDGDEDRYGAKPASSCSALMNAKIEKGNMGRDMHW